MISFEYREVLFPDMTKGVEVTATETKKKMVFCTDLIQFEHGLTNYKTGVKHYIQDAFPFLSAVEREFLISGLTPEEFDLMFPPEEEEDNGVGNKD